MSKEITIVGAGLVGSLLSIMLAKEGFKVKVFEKRPNPLETLAESGRSINLALSNRGLLALREAGVEEKVKRLTIPMKGRMLHEPNGQLLLQPYGKEGEQIFSVSRSELTRLLIEEAISSYQVEYHFNEKLESIDVYNKQASFTNLTSCNKSTVSYSLLFGADGAFSAVRGVMEKMDRFNYSQSYLEYGYKELHIDPSVNGSHQMEKNALHIWPREKFMLIALPNLDGSFTVTLFLQFEGEISFANLQTEDQVISFFKTYFPDALELMPTVANNFFNNPTGSLVTIKCFPWIVNNTIALIGDAAHAIVPFYGQGMNAGFEDCRILVDLVRRYQRCDWDSILIEYQSARKENADAIAELAIRNFTEMRDLVANEKFLLRKRIEGRISQKYPEYLPLYSMVTFSKYTYKEALDLSYKQDKLMEKIMCLPGIEEFWETEEFWVRSEGYIKEYLA